MIQEHIGNLFELIPLETENPKLIPHVCNDIHVIGGGFTGPLIKKWPEVKEIYNSYPNLYLGAMQLVKVKPQKSPRYQIEGQTYLSGPNYQNVWVCNMISQSGIIGPDNPKPIKYVALVRAMEEVARTAHHLRRNYFSDKPAKVEIWAPRFGSDLAGGNWNFIVELIDEIWGEFDVHICKLEK